LKVSLIGKDIRQTLNNKLNSPHMYNALTFPLVWGPYTGVELLEIRAHLIVQFNSFKDLPGVEQKNIFEAFLDGVILQVVKVRESITLCETGYQQVSSGPSISIPIEYRMAQLFDTIDASGSKSLPFIPSDYLESKGLDGTSSEGRHNANLRFYQRPGSLCMTQLRHLTEPLNFAYKRGFDRLQS